MSSQNESQVNGPHSEVRPNGKPPVSGRSDRRMGGEDDSLSGKPRSRAARVKEFRAGNFKVFPRYRTPGAGSIDAERPVRNLTRCNLQNSPPSSLPLREVSLPRAQRAVSSNHAEPHALMRPAPPRRRTRDVGHLRRFDPHEASPRRAHHSTLSGYDASTSPASGASSAFPSR